jgi:hypothetical protein
MLASFRPFNKLLASRSNKVMRYASSLELSRGELRGPPSDAMSLAFKVDPGCGDRPSRRGSSILARPHG